MYAGRARESSRDARHARTDAREDLVRDRAGRARDLLDGELERAAPAEDQHGIARLDRVFTRHGRGGEIARHAADERHAWPYSFVTLERRKLT